MSIGDIGGSQAGFVPAVHGKAQAPGMARALTDKDYEARVVVDDSDREEAYALRYRSYHSQGFIPFDRSGLFSDKYDRQSNSATVLVRRDGRAVGSVRVCLLRRGSALSSPARDSYPEEVERLLVESGPERDGFDGLEVNRLVRAPEAEDDQGLVFMLLRMAGYLGVLADFRVSVSCVRRNHALFYRRLRFESAGVEAKLYPGLTCPMELLHLSRSNWDSMRQTFALMDPEAGPPGLLHGLEAGKVVRPHVVRRA